MKRSWIVLFFAIYTYTICGHAREAEEKLFLVSDSDNQDQHSFFQWPESEKEPDVRRITQDKATTKADESTSLSGQQVVKDEAEPVRKAESHLLPVEQTLISPEKEETDSSEASVSLAPGLWMIEETATIINKDEPVHREIKASDVCYSAGFIERETKNGFMLSIGQDFLSGFSCKVNDTMSEGGLLFQQATCQSAEGDMLQLRYTLKLMGQQLVGLLEMRSGTAVFRLDVSGHKIGDCPTESLYDYK